MPKCSVVIPWYRNLDDLDRAVASVMAQTIQDFEVLIVVNGVPESVTDEVQAHFTDDRIRVLYSKEPHASRARNVGLAEAKGDLIFLLDADDVFYPDKFETFLNAFEKEPFDLAFSRGERERGNDVSWSFPIDHWDEQQHISEFFFCDGNTLSASALVLARSAVGKVRFDEFYKPYEDPGILLEAVYLGLKVRMLSEKLYEWNDERTEDRLSQKPNYEERVEWADFMGPKMTVKAALAFKARCVAQHIFPERALWSLKMILQALLGGAITSKEAILFVLRGLIPGSLRRRLISYYFLRRDVRLQES